MENDLISIVVPIYKVEKYLKKCLDSIINQSYRNLEIILIDDGSPDNCGKICDEYAIIDNRIKVVHKENGGLSDARNCGIDIAKGKYITFVDSDDYIESQYVEKLYDAIQANNTKMSQCNILIVDDNGEILEKTGYENISVKTSKELLKELYGEHCIENIVAWNKMYERELFKDLRYPTGKIHEDEFTTYKILYNIDKVAIANDYLYNYRKNENSITERKFNLKRLDMIEAFEERMQFFENKNEFELYISTLLMYMQKIKECYIKTKKFIDNSKTTQRELIKKYRKNYVKILQFKNISNVKKIKWFLFYILPGLYFYLKQ